MKSDQRVSSRVVAGLVSLPALCIVGLLIVVGYLSFRVGGLPSGHWTLDNYRSLFSDPAVTRVLLNTALYGLVTTVVAMSLGTAMAWLVERTDFGWRRTIGTLMLIRLVIPGFFTAMAWLFMFHPRIGTLNRWIADVFGGTGGPVDITSLVGMGFVEGLGLSAVAFIFVSSGLRSMDSSLEEAARANGVGIWTTVRRITLPLIFPSMAAAGIFVTTISLASLDVPLVLGLADNNFVFSSYLYVESRPSAGSVQYGIPAAFSTFMVLLALAVTWWYTRVLNRSRNYQVVSGKGYRPQPIALGRWRWLGWAFVGNYFLWSTFLPILVVFWMSTQPFVQSPSSEAFAVASWDNYRNIDWSTVLTGLKTTAQVMVLAPTLAVVMSLGFSWIVVRSRLRFRRLYDLIAFMPQAVPQLVFALGALLVALYWTRGWYDLLGTLALLVGVMALVQVAFATRMLNAGLIQLHPELEEAAAMSGASSFSTMRRVVLPLLRPAILYTWLWLALLSFRDLTIPTLLGSADTQTLSLVVWRMINAGSVTEASAVTILMLVLMVPLVAIFLRMDRRRDGDGTGLAQ